MTASSALEPCELPPQSGLAGTKTGSRVRLSMIEVRAATGLSSVGDDPREVVESAE